VGRVAACLCGTQSTDWTIGQRTTALRAADPPFHPGADYAITTVGPSGGWSQRGTHNARGTDVLAARGTYS
jgi:hypothetical protein